MDIYIHIWVSVQDKALYLCVYMISAAAAKARQLATAR